MQSSPWLDVNAGVPQGSVLGPLLFLIYINDLPDNLVCRTKLFADDTSIFSTVYESTSSSVNLNKDLSTIKNWAFQWKMAFNPDPNKQATEVIFSRKRKPVNHPILYFNNSPVTVAPFQKHLGLILDEKLTFGHHLNEKISKANKGIGLIKRLHSFLPQKFLLVIYKSFVRPHLDYGDVIYDQPHNNTFCRLIESVQYNAALAITGAIKGSSRERDSTRSLDSKALVIEDGTVGLFIFLILSLYNVHHIYAACCLKNSDHMTPKEAIYLELLVQKANILRTPFIHIVLVSGINWIPTLETLHQFLYLKKLFLHL